MSFEKPSLAEIEADMVGKSGIRRENKEMLVAPQREGLNSWASNADQPLLPAEGVATFAYYL